MSIRAKVLACGLAGSAAIALTACGGSASGPAAHAHRDAATLVSEMKAAVGGAKSVHMAGRLSHGGRSVAVNLGVFRTGALTGTITQGGVRLELIGAQGKVYVKATPAFLRELRASAAVCAIICGKYVQMSGLQASDLAGSLSMMNLTRSLTGGLPRFTRSGTTTVGGQSAVVLRGADGSTLDVAAHGKPYPLRVVAPPDRNETVLFSQWDAVATPAAPRAGEVINLNQLKAGTS